RAAPRAFPVGAKASPPPGRDVVAREPRRLPGLAVARTLLVDRARCDLLGRVLGLPVLEEGVLDVLVLPGPLAPFLHSTWRHGLRSFLSRRGRCPGCQGDQRPSCSSRSSSASSSSRSSASFASSTASRALSLSFPQPSCASPSSCFVL